ncbi:FAD-dependent oxidoreductase [Actinomycetaceae bacterium L2_0104]
MARRKTNFPNLFTPVTINSLTLKNRIVATPTGDFFEDKALGGPAVVITGHAIVEPGRSSYSSPDEPDAFAKYERESTRHRVLKVHQAGGRASLEIFHGGQFARVKDFARGPVSFVRDDGTPVKAMDPDDMEYVAGLFAACAANAQELGFDMIFLHFGHGWLPAQFLSPRTNHRTDDYGGSLKNRARFPLQILKAVREAVGPNFPVDMRISAIEWMENSISFSDTLEFITMAERYLDTVQISAGVDIGLAGNVHLATTNLAEHAPNARWAREVKRNVKIPVSVVGAIMSPTEAEEIISSGSADLVALGRPLIADPQWPRKAQEGREDEIVPCIRCLQCYHISTERKKVGCSVNARFWNESFIPRGLEPAARPRRLVVVGGGVGGIVAATTAAERGHEVILLEAADELGGQLRWVAKEHYKDDIRAYLDYLRRTVARSTVDVRLSTEATPEMVAELEPDGLVVAIGADEIRPPIPGVDQRKVYSGTEAIDAESELGKQVAIVGAGSIGTEIGLELATFADHSVTMIDIGDTWAPQANILYREALRQEIAAQPRLSFQLESTCSSIQSDHVVVTSKDGELTRVPADDVILSVGMRARSSQARAFFGIVPDTVLVGDCVRPRIIQDAVFEAYSYAMNF